MTSCTNVRQNDIGTEFLATIVECVDSVETPIDISNATSKTLVIRKPDGTVLTNSAVFTPVSSGGTGTGTDGKISYFSVSGDLDLKGLYRIQGIVSNPSGTWSSSIDKFKVSSNL